MYTLNADVRRDNTMDHNNFSKCSLKMVQAYTFFLGLTKELTDANECCHSC